MQTQSIIIDGNNNILVQGAQGEDIAINTRDGADILQKLQALDEAQMEMLHQIARAAHDKFSDLFKALLKGFAPQKR